MVVKTFSDNPADPVAPDRGVQAVHRVEGQPHRVIHVCPRLCPPSGPLGAWGGLYPTMADLCAQVLVSPHKLSMPDMLQLYIRMLCSTY